VDTPYWNLHQDQILIQRQITHPLTQR